MKYLMTAIISASLLFLFSCDKYDKQIILPNEDVVALEGCGDLDGYEIDSVGIIHNYYLKQIFSNFDFDATDPLNEYYNNYIGLTIMADGFELDSLVKDTLYNRLVFV
jgi:hypothetical protein